MNYATQHPFAFAALADTAVLTLVYGAVPMLLAGFPTPA
jgi:hypothetical protein